MIIYASGFGHMTNMTGMPTYGKKPFTSLLLQNQKADDLGTCYVALRLRCLLNVFK